MMRVFSGGVCLDHAPAENTPEGALVALAPLTDPNMDSGARDPMALPPSLAYLDGSLGLAVAAAPAPDQDVTAVAFAEGISPATLPIGFSGGLSYLTAGIDG